MGPPSRRPAASSRRLGAEVAAEHYARSADGGWILREYRAGSAFSLSSAEVVLSVDELYEGAFDLTVAG